MAGKGQMVWRGAVEMGNNCTVYGNKVIEAVTAVANYFAPVIETYAKRNAKWTDRSANARQTLHSWVDMVSKDAVALYLSHGMYYGVFLEAKYSGRYAIIWPTLQAHIQPIYNMLKGIFGK
jgi:hypothetical protein